MAAPFAFIHVASYIFFFLLHYYNWQVWICCLCAFLMCPSTMSPRAGGAMRSPGPVAWAGHISHPDEPVRLCLLCRAGRRLDFPTVCCC